MAWKIEEVLSIILKIILVEKIKVIKNYSFLCTNFYLLFFLCTSLIINLYLFGPLKIFKKLLSYTYNEIIFSLST